MERSNPALDNHRISPLFTVAYADECSPLLRNLLTCKRIEDSLTSFAEF